MKFREGRGHRGPCAGVPLRGHRALRGAGALYESLTPSSSWVVSQMFHAQVGNRSRTSDALNVASSMFYDGMEKFSAGELTSALELFEQALSINQKYLTPAASGCVLCYNNIAAVHDRLGNLNQAVSYYERARVQLSSKQLPQAERGARPYVLLTATPRCSKESLVRWEGHFVEF